MFTIWLYAHSSVWPGQRTLAGSPGLKRGRMKGVWNLKVISASALAPSISFHYLFFKNKYKFLHNSWLPLASLSSFSPPNMSECLASPCLCSPHSLYLEHCSSTSMHRSSVNFNLGTCNISLPLIIHGTAAEAHLLLNKHLLNFCYRKSQSRQ